MSGSSRPFVDPVYVTRPVVPSLSAYTEKLRNIWDSKWLTNNGEQHNLLEDRLRNFLRVPSLSLFNNGTIALIVACQSQRLSGEVITTPFTFPATPHVLSWNNVRPVFCDIDPITMNIDPKRIESMITAQTTGILAVHVFGTPCEVEAIQEIADRYRLRVVYDAAHAFGVEINGQGIGTFGDVSMFSFHATKLFHTAEGGALTFRDPDLKPHIDLLKNFGIKDEETVMMPGINGKMNELQAALGLVLLEYVEDERAKRKSVLEAYRACLKNVDGLSLVVVDPPGLTPSYQYFVLRINEENFGCSRDQVYREFKKYNVMTRKYFYPLCSEYDCYRHLPSSRPSGLPEAHRVAREVLAMPFYGGLTADDVERICTILKGFRGAGKRP